ncbi:MAG: class II glutamine amidotransferase [Candidatus Acetothermia bacterium]|jgi:predicted glutamine amidotransferase|nr:class II glutamine amidotransferase [Candidatus Acetothermia bacterium]MDH7505371.1 class II glutamine amidotransferase [Candidatus Acetothermia bacterium]
MAKLTATPEPALYELSEAPFSLRNLSRNGNRFNKPRGPHPHGWGVAYRAAGRILITKRAQPAFEDERFTEIVAGIATDLLLGHVRLASPGTRIDEKNAHPFKKDELVLIHNGTIRDLAEPGGNDSEAFLEWLSRRWDRTETGLAGLLREAATSLDYTALNIILTDGRRLFAFRQTLDEPLFLAYYTLYQLREPGKLLVSSEPLDDRPWESLPNGHLLVAQSPSEADILALKCSPPVAKPGSKG